MNWNVYHSDYWRDCAWMIVGHCVLYHIGWIGSYALASWSSWAGKGLGRLGWLPWAIEWYTRVLPWRLEINELFIECRRLSIVLEIIRGKNGGVRRIRILLSECLPFRICSLDWLCLRNVLYCYLILHFLKLTKL